MKSVTSIGWKDYAVVAVVVLVLGLLFTPVSPLALDILLIANVALALTVLLVTFQTEKPLDFSTFPSVLLLSTLLRLALNISATRLILEHGYAGDVIEGIGSFVVGGNYVTGIVVFFILVVIQYVVVTNGAQRVAEVAARFTLDSMPGKQMSIDADLNMGLIDQDEARERRANIEREANFYGAMDGASKFVKGDAIAGILIILINIIGGLAIGIAQKGMTWGDAMHRYTLLTIGDGIVTQIPSLIIAVSTGIIVTRATTDKRLGQEIVRQLFSNYRPLLLVAGALLLSLTLVSIPAVPVLIMAAVLLAGAGLAWRSQRSALAGNETGSSPTSDNLTADDKKDALAARAIQLTLGPVLAQHFLAAASPADVRLESVRQTVSRELGFPLPKIHLSAEPSLAANDYIVRIAGTTAGRHTLYPGQWLAIAGNRASVTLEGIATREPTYGIASVWITPEQRSTAKTTGHTVVEAEMVLYTHVTELLRKHAAELLSRKTVEALVEDKRATLGSLVDELVPAVLSWSDIQRVLQLLLNEQVSIANLELILEVLVDRGRHSKSAEELAEFVRERCGMALADRFLDDSGALHVINLAPAIERRLIPGADPSLALTPAETERLFTAAHALVESRLGSNVHPVILCTPSLRRTLRRLFGRTLPHIPVLSLNEVNNATRLVAGGTISLDSPREIPTHA
jgi:flagellar biosynthesis protein FlhA